MMAAYLDTKRINNDRAAGTRKKSTPPCIPFGVSQYSAMPALAATSAAKDIAYVYLKQVRLIHYVRDLFLLPIGNPNNGSQLGINELGYVYVKGSGYRPYTKHLCNTLHHTPGQSTE
jgi:hypothetical protein